MMDMKFSIVARIKWPQLKKAFNGYGNGTCGLYKLSRAPYTLEELKTAYFNFSRSEDYFDCYVSEAIFDEHGENAIIDIKYLSVKKPKTKKKRGYTKFNELLNKL